MGVWSEASYSQVIHFGRCDGEYFLPAYVRNAEQLAMLDTVPLPRLFHVSDGNHLSISRHFSDDGEVPYFRGQDVNDFFLENASPLRIPESVFTSPMMLRSHFVADDVLLSIVGTIGSLSLVPETLGPATGSCKIAILRSKGTYSPVLLAAFLLSRFGQLQIKRNTRGAVQMGLILKDLVRVRVPILEDVDTEQIEQGVKRAIAANSEAKHLYAEANGLLESELGLDRLSFDRPVGYTARFSEAVAGGRFDGEYFQPKYTALRNAVVSYPHGYEPLSQVADALKVNVDPSKSPGDEFKYVELSQINSSIGLIEGHVESLGAGLPSRARRQVSAGDIIASAVVGSVDKAAIISSAEDGYIASTGFFHFRPKAVSSEYLLMLIRSRCVSMQFQQQATGGILSAVPDGRLKYVIVPRLPQELQDQVTDLVKRAHEAKRESDTLLEQATTRVEQLIEEAIA